MVVRVETSLAAVGAMVGECVVVECLRGSLQTFVLVVGRRVVGLVVPAGAFVGGRLLLDEGIVVGGAVSARVGANVGVNVVRVMMVGTIVGSTDPRTLATMVVAAGVGAEVGWITTGNFGARQKSPGGPVLLGTLTA